MLTFYYLIRLLVNVNYSIICSEYKKIQQRIDMLETDPRHNGSIKMSGKENTYRTRVGKYRIVYEIYDHKVLVVVVNIDHRKDIYR